MNDLSIRTSQRPWLVAVLFILLAMAQTFVSHYSMNGGFDFAQFLDLSAFYLIPIAMWLGIYEMFRKTLLRRIISTPISLVAILGMGFIIVPVQRALSLAVDFGFRYIFGLVDHLDRELLMEIYPYFLSSLPENYLIYLLLVGVTFMLQSSQVTDHRVRIKSVVGYSWIHAEQVQAVHSDRNYVVLETDNERIKCRMTISAAEELFSKHGHVRIHRSIIINPLSIVSMRYIGDQCYELKLASGRVYSSSARYKSQVEELIARNSSLVRGNSSLTLDLK
ncbi:MAG: LytTR family DNA-binding domain-containing protein [Cyclobacteriaceae bacterium]